MIWLSALVTLLPGSISEIGLGTYASDATQTLPNKVFEYMANRLCLVSSLEGELSDLLDEQHCGVSYQAGNARSLATTIANLADDPQRLENYRSNAYATWQNSYRSSSIYPRFVQQLTGMVEPTLLAA